MYRQWRRKMFSIGRGRDRTSTVVFERPKLVHSSGVRGKAPAGGKINIKTILLHFQPISTISLINLSS